MSGPRRKNHTGMFVVAMAVCLFCGILSYKGYMLRKQREELYNRIEELEKQKADEQERADELAYLKLYQQSAKYIEYLARTKLGLVYKDEIIYREENDDSK